MRLATRLVVCLSLGLWASCPTGAAEKGRKVFISVDMEGIAGVVTSDQLGPPGFEYERFRTFMTNEALAAIEGARAAGATEFVVADSHGNGENLLIEKFAKDTRIVRSWPRPLAMMEGIDTSFDAVLFVGYHASTVNPQGVRAHTFSSATLADVRLNGASVTEAAFNAAIAGHFGVPVVMISGDDAFVKEARAVMPDAEAAAVKSAVSFHAAATLTPEAACDLIREKAKRGVERAKQVKPWKIGEPVTLDLRFKNYRPAQLLAYLPIVEQTDAHAIRFKGRDIVEVSRFLEFVTHYEPGLTP
jgi:D-amino peptidase